MSRVPVFTWLVISMECLTPEAAHAQTDLACSVDRPLVVPGGRLQLRTYQVTPGPEAPEWTVSEGTLAKLSSRVYWRVPESLAPGTRLTATAAVRGSTSSCTVSVVGVPSDFTRGPLKPSWYPLLPNGPPPPKCGLYTYILLGGTPGESLRPTVLKALEAYIGFAPFLDETRRFSQPLEINLAFVPARALPTEITPELLLANYDVSASQAIMRSIGGLDDDGVYLVSSLKPISGAAVPKQTVIAVQNLARIPDNVASLWVLEFFRQTSSTRKWDPPALHRLVLYMRTTVAVLAQVAPDARKSIAEWIKLVGE